jgi:serine/threonine protein kinase
MPSPARAGDDPREQSSSPSTVPPDALPVLGMGDTRSSLEPNVTGYEQVRLLGEGSMGVVYCGHDVRLKRPVALKMIKSGMLSPDRLARFHTEAQALARLQHPHIVQVFAWEEHASQPILVLEFVSGGTLEDVLRQGRRSVREVVQLVAILARAVQVAHKAHVVHRDLKPANVLMGPPIEGNSGTTCGGFPKISDFGLCQLADAGTGRTGIGVVLGTPAYMAPEQAQGSTREVGPPVDVWALGVILYRALTGKLPFTADNAVDTMQRVLSTRPTRPTELVPSLPAELEAICLACLRKDASKRPSAGQLAGLLERFLESPEGQSSATLPQGPRPKVRRPLWRFLLMAMLGVLIGGALGIGLRMLLFPGR